PALARPSPAAMVMVVIAFLTSRLGGPRRAGGGRPAPGRLMHIALLAQEADLQIYGLLREAALFRVVFPDRACDLAESLPLLQRPVILRNGLVSQRPQGFRVAHGVALDHV